MVKQQRLLIASVVSHPIAERLMFIRS